MRENHSEESDRAPVPLAGPGGVRRFGGFELDSRAGELRRHGRRIRLQQKPFRFLEILLERPGEAVTREELRQRLWPADVFVDFDHSLNSAANKLRDALGDMAASPRFIETLARGYRFIAPVDGVAPPVVEAPAAVAAPMAPAGGSGRAAARRRWERQLGIGLAGVASLAGLVGWYTLGLGAVPPRRVTLAVMPFQNLSADPAEEFVSDGFTEEMIAQLGRINPDAVGVIARTSVMHYKHTTKRVDEIGAELGAEYLLEGSVRRAGDRVRITAQLIRAEDQVRVWGRSYERNFEDLLALQAEVAGSIADQIGMTFADAAARPPRRSARSPDAYEAYLKGRYFLDKSPRGLEAAIGHFREAIALDPDYAPAYAGLADAFGQLGWGMATRVAPADAYPQARAAALRALALDDQLAEAHVALGRILWKYDWDWAGARQAFERALSLDPNLATAHESYFDYLSAAGAIGQAQEALDRAARLDPLSLTIAYDQGLHRARTGDFAGALDRLHTALELDPTSGFVRHVIGELFEEQEQWPEALRELGEAVRLSPDVPHFVAALAHARARSGDVRGAREALSRLERMAAQAYVSPHDFALAYAGLGEQERALAWLEAAYRGRDPWLSLLGLQHRFAELETDVRFQSLKRRLGLPVSARPISFGG
jgi:TolB-like protein/DNA-binding winged helix-turn-helix (wHTH) protein/Tfp pilus assembly protein PilF